MPAAVVEAGREEGFEGFVFGGITRMVSKGAPVFDVEPQGLSAFLTRMVLTSTLSIEVFLGSTTGEREDRPIVDKMDIGEGGCLFECCI